MCFGGWSRRTVRVLIMKSNDMEISGWGNVGDIPMYAMLDVWVRLGRDSAEFEEWALEKGYAQAWADLCWDVKVASVKAWKYEELG